MYFRADNEQPSFCLHNELGPAKIFRGQYHYFLNGIEISDSAFFRRCGHNLTNAEKEYYTYNKLL